MSDWVSWVIIAVILGIAEVLTLTFVLGLLAIAAGVTAVEAAAGAPGIAQGVTFPVVSVALLGLVLPVARRHRRTPASLKSGTANLVGKRGMVLAEVDTVSGGRVKIGGETWSARPYDESIVIPAGQWVDVLAIDGATAVVHPAPNGALR
jgi:membrane protein implicated in regulation of membrane protease activity